MTDKVKCYIEEKQTVTGTRLYIKCYGYRSMVDSTYQKMAIVEVSTAEPDIVASAVFCQENKAIQKYDLLNKFHKGQVADLKGYYADEKWRRLKKASGLAPEVLRVVSYYLIKKGYTLMILHSAGDEGLVKVYETLGMDSIRGCCYPLALCTSVDNIIKYLRDEGYHKDLSNIGSEEIKILKEGALQDLKKMTEVGITSLAILMLGKISTILERTKKFKIPRENIAFVSSKDEL